MSDLAWTNSFPEARFGKLETQIPLLAYYSGITILALHIWSPTVGVAIVTFGLFLTLLIAPLEYALGASGTAFLLTIGPGLSPYFEWLRWLCLASSAVVLSLRFFLRSRKGRPPASTKFEFLLVLFVVVSAATLTTSKAPTLTMVKLGALALQLFVISRATAHLVEVYGPAAPRRIALGLLAHPMGLLIWLLVTLATSAGSPVGNQLLGPAGNPNAWGGLIAQLLPLVACPLFRRWPQTSRTNPLLAIGVVTLGYFLVLSVSRAALLGALAATVVFGLAHASRKTAAVVMLATIGLSVPLLTDPEFLPNLSRRYLYKHQRGQQDIFESREEPWKISRSSFQQNPWMGLGFGVTSVSEAKAEFSVRSGAGSIETGSSFWGTLVQVGILGATPLFLAAILLLASAGRYTLRVKDPWFTGMYGSTLVLAVSSLFNGWLIAPGSAGCAYFWTQCYFLNAMMCRFRPAPAKQLPPESPQISAALA